MPPMATGCDAPMWVSGAIAATSAAIMIKAPADVARAPWGAVYTMIASLLLSMACMISRVESSRPPGVSSSMSTACAPCSSAFAMPLRR